MFIGLIVKVSKLCNLRCTYCYETPELDNPARMSLPNIEKMFVHLRDYLLRWGRGQNRVQFIWHGGEPFAQPLLYWEEIMALQKRVFGGHFQRQSIHNAVQSNLTLLTDRHLPLLRRHFHLGFSYDVINDYRVNTAGQATAEVVQKKVDWLVSKKIPAGGIAVISRANVEEPQRVASYFLERGLGFRVLNIYEGLDEQAAIGDCAVSFEAYLGFLRALWGMPSVRKAIERGAVIEPFSEAKGILEKSKTRRRRKVSLSQCEEKEWVLAVNTNGDVYSPGDMYREEYRYGNIFSQTLEECLDTEGRRKRIEKTRERIQNICSHCPFFQKGCQGTFVSHATPEDYRQFAMRGACTYRLVAEMMGSDLSINQTLKGGKHGKKNQEIRNRPREIEVEAGADGR